MRSPASGVAGPTRRRTEYPRDAAGKRSSAERGALSQGRRTLRLVPISVVPTAYGHAASQALRDAVARAKRGDALAPVTVVVPTNSVGVSARRRLASDELGPVSEVGRGVVGLAFVTI